MQDTGEGRILDPDRWATGVAGERIRAGRLRSDSRTVEDGDVFVALGRGARVRDHITQALERGAALVLTDDSVTHVDARVRGIPHLSDVIGALADEYTGSPSADMSLVGVTGTNGKTSTVQLLAQSWDRLGMGSASIGTLGAGMHGALAETALTTPSVTDMHELLADVRRAGAEAVGIELSSHALIQGRVDGCRFDIAAFTNLTRDHLDYHASMEAYGEAKRRILALPGIRAAVLNVDDPFVASLSVPGGLRRVGVSTRGLGSAEVSASDIRLRPDGADFTLDVDGERIEVRSPLIGRFNVDNLTMTAAILHAQGRDAADIATAVGRTDRVPGRMQVVGADAGGPLVVVDYAHTPDALRQALEALSSRRGRLVLVFGCTGDRDRGKRPEMARIAEAGADVVVLTDDDVHHEDGDAIIADVLSGFRAPGAVVVDRDRASAIRAAIASSLPEDTVLIAGKGHEAVQVVGDGIIASDDAGIAASALHNALAGAWSAS
ncbi:UDP-N-acetylmuramoyl-L-alanyl-D-glutamate--2,6-diaminopimelate ligase [Microbacterium imperiale]|uniref:UDP-N-acetylmuramyl-tripeptide synthetase n=2 Tax=Microbacterium imperiale TaxID=33884 RepID=A0A9W6HH81_9MICO|nr:UDP-N-acetylmuramoyl-L-alanyl-D-glutamate--2,6-diaminopimelate ligase [Microbacterium imperiale]MDS0200545.1 UDP-N-acetylmuramoyl-L-alanyl-D-glutamate--2,6-diaminopimelate ligase [Microbacterium imperiale]BFE40850.1 UDP-N-acetylmuramoyl-L-alanyl-D-glutamate--2,6-diaminopimelate ligase [Microbacterium imperiale]GLJ79974.1 UDP-N-acetylmuramoyl-L-alanyl-D-glutamate--2,6-diaminopimelate ligase [Microbacterium imperiale]